ncbi:hypothetical protein BGZ58_007729 [Dissophora ornata]|nr:hypothetical protein BGZ58_007729 [Dissophora ornata]
MGSYQSEQDFCCAIKALTLDRYKQAVEHCAPASSQPCPLIYRNWDPADLQRKEKQLTSGSEDTRFLIAYPAQKYSIDTRSNDRSPIVNEFFNMLGHFFCATSEAEQPGNADSGGPVKTSPYGKTRFQTPFEDLQERLFPSFRLYFADHYKVKEDWYIQLVVVPSWNRLLEEQCTRQGLVLLDIDSNPFFFRSPRDTATISKTPKDKYRCCNKPKLWMELLIGCDVIPTSEVGEIVVSELHALVRKTTNYMTEQQKREQHAAIWETVSKDLIHLADDLRRGSGTVDQEMLGMTFQLSTIRSRIGVLCSAVEND